MYSQLEQCQRKVTNSILELSAQNSSDNTNTSSPPHIPLLSLSPVPPAPLTPSPAPPLPPQLELPVAAVTAPNTNNISINVVDENDPETARLLSVQAEQRQIANNHKGVSTRSRSNVTVQKAPIATKPNTSSFSPTAVGPSGAKSSVESKQKQGVILADIWDSINTQPHPFYTAQVSMEKIHVITRALIASDNSKNDKMRHCSKADQIHHLLETSKLIQNKRLTYYQDLHRFIDDVAKLYHAVSTHSNPQPADIPLNNIHHHADYHIFLGIYPEYGVENIDFSRYTIEQITVMRQTLLNESVVMDVFIAYLRNETSFFSELKAGKSVFKTNYGVIKIN